MNDQVGRGAEAAGFGGCKSRLTLRGEKEHAMLAINEALHPIGQLLAGRPDAPPR